MPLSIKDPEVQTLAEALAQATGEPMITAVIRAIQERLDRVRRQQQSDAMAAELLAIGARCAASLTATPSDHGRLHYDEVGLPK